MLVAGEICSLLENTNKTLHWSYSCCGVEARHLLGATLQQTDPANINTTRVHLPVWWWDAAGKCENRYQQTPVLLDTDPDGLLRAANCTTHSAAAFNTALGPGTMHAASLWRVVFNLDILGSHYNCLHIIRLDPPCIQLTVLHCVHWTQLQVVPGHRVTIVTNYRSAVHTY